MMTKWSFFRGGCNGNLILTITFLLAGNCVLAAGQTDEADGKVYKFFSLKHISAEQGRQYLSEVVTGTVNPYPGPSTPTLFMTADDPREIAKAGAVLDLVDTREKFVIKAIFPVSAAMNMPSNEQIAAKLNPSLTRGVSIGSFSNPPQKDASTRAIIDIHNKTVITIAPVSLLDRIVAAIGQPPSQSNPKVQDKPKVQKKVEAPAKLNVSKSPVPNEAKFLLAASGAVETQPGAVAAGQPQETLDKAAADEVPEPNDAATDGPSEIMAVPDGDDIVNLALADFEKLTIVQFLGLVGPYLQLDFMYDPGALVGEVTISPNGKWRGPIKVKDLYPMLEEVLKFKDLAMTRSEGNLVTIVRVADALKIDPALLEIDKAETEPGDGIVQRVFKLEHIDAASAQNLLTGMSLTTNITPIAETKTLIVTGYAYRMPRIQALLDIVDRAGEPKKFRFRQLRYTMAEMLAPKLQTLAEQLGTIAITVTQTSSSATPATTPSKPRQPNETTAQYQARLRRESAARAAAAARARTTAARTPTTTQQPEPGKPTVYLDADERTNRILMIGLDEQLDEVEELIDTLDVVQQDLRTLELYKIEHVDAEEVKNKLEELGISTPKLTSPYSSRLTGGTKPATTT
ncbi:MAG: secretin N-terminal domain-containing protein, partial [Planctomycetota bacterium]